MEKAFHETILNSNGHAQDYFKGIVIAKKGARYMVSPRWDKDQTVTALLVTYLQGSECFGDPEPEDNVRLWYSEKTGWTINKIISRPMRFYMSEKEIERNQQDGTYKTKKQLFKDLINEGFTHLEAANRLVYGPVSSYEGLFGIQYQFTETEEKKMSNKVSVQSTPEGVEVGSLYAGRVFQYPKGEAFYMVLGSGNEKISHGHNRKAAINLGTGKLYTEHKTKRVFPVDKTAVVNIQVG